MRFLNDMERLVQRPIKILRSDKYTDIYDVFKRTGYLVGPKGARCTKELKKNVRKAYELPGDVHIFGFTADEQDRIDRFDETQNIQAEFPLAEKGVLKEDCYWLLAHCTAVQLPAMYRLGYNNNNCIGCVKGQMGYWNKIRIDFPEYFWRMARIEREMDVAINKRYERGVRIRVFLDELDPEAGRYDPPENIECGVLCTTA
jgi:hypothetical protein